MTDGSFGCGCGTTERALTRRFLGGGSRAGHYGLPGMQERAKLVGGELAVWSEIDSGTETELTIPPPLPTPNRPPRAGGCLREKELDEAALLMPPNCNSPKRARFKGTAKDAKSAKGCLISLSCQY